MSENLLDAAVSEEDLIADVPLPLISIPITRSGRKTAVVTIESGAIRWASEHGRGFLSWSELLEGAGQRRR